MLINNTVARKLIKKNLGIDTKNCNARYIWEHTVGMFLYEIENNEDFFFVLVDKDKDEKTGHYPLADGLLQIYIIPHEISSNWERTSVGEKDFSGKPFIKFLFSDSRLVYHENRGIINENLPAVKKVTRAEAIKTPPSTGKGDELTADRLTMRDYACVHLRVPESNKDWLNELIKKSNVR